MSRLSSPGARRRHKHLYWAPNNDVGAGARHERLLRRISSDLVRVYRASIPRTCFMAMLDRRSRCPRIVCGVDHE